MPRTCTICTHPDRQAIDRMLVDQVALRTIADRWSVSKTALIRHKSDHLPTTITQARHAAQVAHADTLLADLSALRGDAARLAAKAEAADSFPAAIGAIREQARIIELLLRVAGELASGPTINIHTTVAWMELRTQILVALAPFPDARLALAEVLDAED